MSKDEFLTGIVTYNPELGRLRENIEAAVLQVGNILIIDNGSDNQERIEDLIQEYPQIDIVKFDKNLGISYALRRLMDKAVSENYKWVLTLDQDSVILPSLIEHYLEKCELECAGALTCDLVDRNYEKNIDTSVGVVDVFECFTSGFFLNCEAYLKTDGYNAELFIDYVDYDICYKLLEQGETIKKIKFSGVLHEYGHAEYKKFLWKQIIVTHHPCWRKYYMTRNDIWMSVKHPTYVAKSSVCRRIIAMIIKSIIYERHKMKSLFYIAKGIVDGKRNVDDTEM